MGKYFALLLNRQVDGRTDNFIQEDIPSLYEDLFTMFYCLKDRHSK